jgi:hypothetical protein
MGSQGSQNPFGNYAAPKNEHHEDPDYGDDEEDEVCPTCGSGGDESEFIRFDDGLRYIKKWEIVATEWDKYYDNNNQPRWRLKIFFNDCPHSIVHGDEAREIMIQLGLPPDPPASKQLSQ